MESRHFRAPIMASPMLVFVFHSWLFHRTQLRCEYREHHREISFTDATRVWLAEAHCLPSSIHAELRSPLCVMAINREGRLTDVCRCAVMQQRT